MAEEPTARSSPIAGADGIRLVAAPGIPTGSLKPNFSATPTSLAAPTFAPSGAKTELHEWANELRNVPPHDSPLAFSRGTPSRLAEDCMGKVSESLTFRASSAAEAVM